MDRMEHIQPSSDLNRASAGHSESARPAASSSRNGILDRTTLVPAIAGNLHGSTSVFAILAAVVGILPDRTGTGRMSTFFGRFASHNDLLFTETAR